MREVISMFVRRTTVVNQMFVSLTMSHSFTHSLIQFVRAGQCLTQSELSIRLEICAQSWKLNNTPTLFLSTIMKERDTVSLILGFDLLISACLLQSQATGSNVV